MASFVSNSIVVFMVFFLASCGNPSSNSDQLTSKNNGEVQEVVGGSSYLLEQTSKIEKQLAEVNIIFEEEQKDKAFEVIKFLRTTKQAISIYELLGHYVELNEKVIELINSKMLYYEDAKALQAKTLIAKEYLMATQGKIENIKLRETSTQRRFGHTKCFSEQLEDLLKSGMFLSVKTTTDEDYPTLQRIDVTVDFTYMFVNLTFNSGIEKVGNLLDYTIEVDPKLDPLTVKEVHVLKEINNQYVKYQYAGAEDYFYITITAKDLDQKFEEFSQLDDSDRTNKEEMGKDILRALGLLRAKIVFYNRDYPQDHEHYKILTAWSSSFNIKQKKIAIYLNQHR